MPSLSSAAKRFLALGGFAALIAVALGAFGAHGLKAHLSAEQLAIWHTGVEYQFVHALGLLAIGIVAALLPDSSLLKWSGALMCAGIVFFSGSLYALALTGISPLGAIAPVGGVAFILAWVLFVAAVLRRY